MTVGRYEAALISCSTGESWCLFTSAAKSPSGQEPFRVFFFCFFLFFFLGCLSLSVADVLLMSLLLGGNECRVGTTDWLTG